MSGQESAPAKGDGSSDSSTSNPLNSAAAAASGESDPNSSSATANPTIMVPSAGFAIGNDSIASNKPFAFNSAPSFAGNPFSASASSSSFFAPSGQFTPSGIPIVSFAMPPTTATGGPAGSGMSFGAGGFSSFGAPGAFGGASAGTFGGFGGFGGFSMPASSYPSSRRRQEEPVGEPLEGLHELATKLHADATLSLEQRRRTFTDAFVKLWKEAQQAPLRYNTKLQMLKNSIDVTQLIVGDYITSSFAEKTIPLIIFDTVLETIGAEPFESENENDVDTTVLAVTIQTLWLSHECPLVLSHEVLPLILDNLSQHGYNCALNTKADEGGEPEFQSIIDLIVSYGTTWYTGQADNEEAHFPKEFFWRSLEILVSQPSCTAEIVNAPHQSAYDQFGPALASWIDSYSHVPDICLPMIKILRKDLSKIADPNVPMLEVTAHHFFVIARHPYSFLLWLQWELQQDQPRKRLLQFCTQSKSCRPIHASAASSSSPEEITLMTSLVEEAQTARSKHPNEEATARNVAIVDKLVAFQNAQADLVAESAESLAGLKEFQEWVQQQIDNLPPALKGVQKSREEQMMDAFNEQR